MEATVNSDNFLKIWSERNLHAKKYFNWVTFQQKTIRYQLLIIFPHIYKHEKMFVLSIKCTFLIVLLFLLILCRGHTVSCLRNIFATKLIARYKFDQESGSWKAGSRRGNSSWRQVAKETQNLRGKHIKDLDEPNQIVGLSKMESFPEKAIKLDKVEQTKAAEPVQDYCRAISPSPGCYFLCFLNSWASPAPEAKFND